MRSSDRQRNRWDDSNDDRYVNAYLAASFETASESIQRSVDSGIDPNQLDASPPVTSSNFLRWYYGLTEKELANGVAIYCRVSGREQGRRGTLLAYLLDAIKTLRFDGVVLRKTFIEVSPGWLRDERTQLLNAFQFAIKNKIPLVSHFTDRFLRNQNYQDSQHRDYWPTPAEWESFAVMANGATLATFRRPNASDRCVEQFRSKLGKEFHQKYPPRQPSMSKSAWRERNASLVEELTRAGFSVREIGILLRTSPSTVHDWKKK